MAYLHVWYESSWYSAGGMVWQCTFEHTIRGINNMTIVDGMIAHCFISSSLIGLARLVCFCLLTFGVDGSS